MFLLFLLQLWLATLSPGAASDGVREKNPTGQQNPKFSALTLNESCREQILQRARALIVQLLLLDHPPRLTSSMTRQVREEWANERRRSLEPSVGGRPLRHPNGIKVGLNPAWRGYRESSTYNSSLSHQGYNGIGEKKDIISNQTLVTQRGGCLQISQRVTLDDLGWQNWVLSPTSFIFTECLGCHCHRIKEGAQLELWSLACGLQEPSPQGQADAQQRRCCRSRKTPLPFLFLKEDGSLNLQTVRLAHDCHCRP